MKDFEKWCGDSDVNILNRVAVDYEWESEINWLPYLRATDAIYVISDGQ